MLLPWVSAAHATIFSRAAYVPEGLRDARVAIVRPAIDPFSPKNQELAPDVVEAILVRAGVVEGRPDGAVCVFRRADGSPARVDRGADILRVGRAPGPDVPLVVQVSRWDRLKDHLGVMRAFAGLEAADAAGAHLVLAGPSVTGIADDPDGPAVLAELTADWRALPHDLRRRIQIVSLPMVDPTENAAMVNALQRRAAVVVQKSLREGYGLTVAEAMWKGRAVVASAVGGIADQIDDGVDGLLVDDPRAPAPVRHALTSLLADEARCERLGTAARARVRADGLGLRLLAEDAGIQRELAARAAAQPPPSAPARPSRTSAPTTVGQNRVPAPARVSASASRGARAGRPGASFTSPSQTSATARIRASMGIRSPARPSG
jgi:trehalose synthase